MDQQIPLLEVPEHGPPQPSIMATSGQTQQQQQQNPRFVLNMSGIDARRNSNNMDPQHLLQQIANAPLHSIANNGISSEEHHDHAPPPRAVGGQNPQQPSVQLNILKALEGYLPFILLLIVKNFYSHRLGILIFAFLFWTLYYADSTFRNYTTPRPGEPHNRYLCWIIFYLMCNILSIYYVFQAQLLHQSLIMVPPPLEGFDMWTLLWRVCITDFILKYACIISKAAVTLTPISMISYKSKGRCYMLIEHIFQSYACLLPIVPWLCYLWGDGEQDKWFAVILIFVYFILKSFNIWAKIQELREVFKAFRMTRVSTTKPFGRSPSRCSIEKADNSCAICHDEFTDAVQISCKHIFCEDCITLWFDRERTCPICRTAMKPQPKFRDGSTSKYIQFY